MLIMTIFTLTVVDMLLTRHGLALGRIQEANVLLASLLTWHRDYPLLIGMTVTAAALCLLHGFASRFLWVRPCLWGILMVRSTVAAAHLHWLLFG